MPNPPWMAALGVALVMQTMSACLTRLFPVMAPALVLAAGVSPAGIGMLSALGAAGTMAWLLLGNGVLAGLGPVRCLQLGAAIGALGMAFALAGTPAALMLAALLLGLGYGPSPPAGSDILKRHAPVRHRSLVFSIKQSGVPLGGALAGLAVPPLLALGGFRLGCLAALLLSLAAVLVVQPWRGPIDAGHAVGGGWRAMLAPTAMTAPFRLMLADPALRAAGFSGLGFAVAQGCVFTFLVSALTLGAGFGLASAGAAFAIMQGVGVAGRILVGWLADRLGSARRMLLGLAFASAATTAALSLITADWPAVAVAGLCALGGIAIASWNGVFLAHIAMLVPDAAVGQATSATTFVVFTGYAAGPALMGAALAAGLSYATSFLLVALLPLAGGLVSLMVPPRPP